MKATAKNIQAVANIIENTKTRSAWDKGVKSYAFEMLERFEEWSKYNEANGEELPTIDEETALNGASSWTAWAYGGCGLVYDYSICVALCTTSEKVRTDYGAKQPNPRETWLDVEARAARQAWALIAREVARLEA